MARRATVLTTVFATLLAGAPLPGGVPAERVDLGGLTRRPYLELLELREVPAVSEKQASNFRRLLDQEERGEAERLRSEERRLREQIETARKDLDRLNKSSSRDTDETTSVRRELHCRILRLERDLHLKETEREQGLPLSFDNRRAKLDLLLQWPERRREVEARIAEGRARERKFGDVEDIGIRQVGEGQEKDIRTGEEAYRNMKAYGLVPPEIEDAEVNSYVKQIAERIARNSDLKVPVRVTLLDSDEINAFALPGGLLFVNSGLIARAESESELAGVLAHEIAHATGRHGARLMKRATIANIIFQAAQIAGSIFTGGAVGLGTYYALQYGSYGLGMLLNLSLLGVSRDFEEEADQLGAQYAWKAGYDPRGFITFFDKMASEKGYVKAASFFRTHPPFYQRILGTMSEILYLPSRTELVVNSIAFDTAKERLRKYDESEKTDPKVRPTLKRMPDCDDPR